MGPRLIRAAARPRSTAARTLRIWRTRRRADRDRRVDELVAAALRTAGTGARAAGEVAAGQTPI